MEGAAFISVPLPHFHLLFPLCAIGVSTKRKEKNAMIETPGSFLGDWSNIVSYANTAVAEYVQARTRHIGAVAMDTYEAQIEIEKLETLNFFFDKKACIQELVEKQLVLERASFCKGTQRHGNI